MNLYTTRFMRYLLIDFGATYIKCALYDCVTITPTKNYHSPFSTRDRLSKQQLQSLLVDITNDHESVDGIVICTILGGTWDVDIYKSWKCASVHDKGVNCMISGIFDSNIVHNDHADFTTASQYVEDLRVIGTLNNIPVYTPLGDTNCVIRSLHIPDNGVAINMGTGSQVISNTHIERFFPAGRSFLVFNRLFENSSHTLFDIMQDLTVEDVKQSTLDINLAVFDRAQHWNGGGLISGIVEPDFTLKNLVSSILRCFVNQYRDAVGNASQIELVGGIANKVSILPDLFRYYYPGREIRYRQDNIEATHRGLVTMINKHILQ
jgi:hypothetical protein